MESAEGSGSRLRGIGLRELYASVLRDLDWLLNSKRWFPDASLGLPEASESILEYGVPDLSTYSWKNSRDATSIARVLEEAVRRFEPRLRPSTVKVTPLPTEGIADFRLRFRIEAVLHVEPINEPIAFDTDVDFDSSRIYVKGNA